MTLNSFVFWLHSISLPLDIIFVHGWGPLVWPTPSHNPGPPGECRSASKAAGGQGGTRAQAKCRTTPAHPVPAALAATW